MWDEFKDKLGVSATSYLFFFKDTPHNPLIDIGTIAMLQEKYFYFMGLLKNTNN